MTTYHWMGIGNFVLLGAVLSVAPYVMFGRHSKAKVFLIASSVLIVMLAITVCSMLIYSEYHS